MQIPQFTDVLFNIRSDAWAFMRDCDEAALSAGFPTEGPVSYRVRVLATPEEVSTLAARRGGVIFVP